MWELDQIPPSCILGKYCYIFLTSLLIDEISLKLLLFLKQDFRSTWLLEELVDKMKHKDWVNWAQKRWKRLELKRWMWTQKIHTDILLLEGSSHPQFMKYFLSDTVWLELRTRVNIMVKSLDSGTTLNPDSVN